MGIRLAFSESEKLVGRCWVASVRLTSDEEGYDDGSVVPHGPWQPLTRDDAECLQADDATPDSVQIELIHRPLPHFATDDEDGRMDAAARLDSLPRGWPTELLGCTASPADSDTTTQDSANGLRIGMHVDQFERLPYSRRHESRRRLCLNLGPGPRYLLLADRDIQQICQDLGADVQRHYPHTEDIRRYVAEGRPLRCLRIRLKPGEGYIAPTEFLPHDGSTSGIEQPSVAAFWLGRTPHIH
ncbi:MULTISPECIES: hypothetical protein [Streptomyces]|uniref:hypothetical protein n=1 Tax=Streptomyces TaxID=1883 RepID=UPI0034254ADA